MDSKNQWRQVIQRVIRSEMSIKGVKYQGLSERLAAIGVDQSADNLRNKINKGIMGADLFVQILCVLQARALSVDDLQQIITDINDNNG